MAAEYIRIPRAEYERLLQLLERAVRLAEAWRGYALRLERRMRRLEKRRRGERG